MAEMAQILQVPEGRFRELWLTSFDDRVTGRFRDIEENMLAICQQLGQRVDRSRVLQAVVPFREFTRESLEPSASTLNILDRLREKGLLLGLASNCSPAVPYSVE
jgi:hypothetical protein